MSSQTTEVYKDQRVCCMLASVVQRMWLEKTQYCGRACTPSTSQLKFYVLDIYFGRTRCNICVLLVYVVRTELKHNVAVVVANTCIGSLRISQHCRSKLPRVPHGVLVKPPSPDSLLNCHPTTGLIRPAVDMFPGLIAETKCFPARCHCIIHPRQATQFATN